MLQNVTQAVRYETVVLQEIPIRRPITRIDADGLGVKADEHETEQPLRLRDSSGSRRSGPTSGRIRLL
jgi:hypothetical protein